jgi:hypothetical protein
VVTVPRAVCSCALALILAGCGGGDEGNRSSDPAGRSKTASGERLTKNEFLARGDSICADAQAELALIQKRVDKARSMPPSEQGAEVEAIWRRQLEIARRYRARFSALQPPEADDARMREFMRTLNEGIKLSRQIIEYLDDREEPPREMLEEYGKVVYRGNALAQAYGFTVCGRSN